MKQNAFMTEWEPPYHEVLDISKTRSNTIRSIQAETDAITMNKELQSKNMKDYYEVLKQVLNFFNERGNPYKVVKPVKLHHFISNKAVPSNKSDYIFSFLRWEQKLHEILWRACHEKRKEACLHYKMKHSATIFAKNQTALPENVMLKIHPWND